MINYLKNLIKQKIYSYRTGLEISNNYKKILDEKDLKYYIKSFGTKNSNKIFYVIQRSPGGGLFSNLNYVIHHLSICDELNFIPIIDMKNFTTKYNSKNKFNSSNNAWEYYFSKVSKYKLDDVYKSKKVIISDSKTRKINYFDSFQSLNYSHLKAFKKYIKINNKILIKSKKFKNKYFKNYKILGVHFRGSDMKYQERHPFPPTVRQIINAIDFYIKKYKYKKIFLVTEEIKYLTILKKKYGNKLIYYNSFRSNKIDIFNNSRKLHRAKIGEENIIDMLLLKDTDRIICSRSHLPDASLYFNPKLKNKIHIIENGNNSNNIVIAQFLWKLKILLPKEIGGFK